MTSLVLPHNVHQPLFFSTLGEDAVDLAAVAGLYLDEWQQEVVKTSLTFDAEGYHAARQMLLLVPRQQGKNVCIEARELAALFLLKEKVILHTAHEYKTAQSSFMRLREHIERTPMLLEDFGHVRFRNSGAETSILITPHEGDDDQPTENSRYLMFSPRTKGAGRGFTVELLIVDEAYAYDANQASALAFTQNQSKNPQAWFTSSTGFEDSLELLALREMGLSQYPSMGFFEWKADDGCDPGDMNQWMKALPGLTSGRQRISEIQGHYAKAKAQGDFTDFNREILGLWATTDLPAAITEKQWNDVQYVEGEPDEIVGEMSFAIDVAPDYSSAAVYAAGENENGQYHVQLAADDNGIHWLPEYLRSIQDKYKPKSIAVDVGGPASAIVTELDSAGVKYTAMSASDVVAACGMFYNLVIGNRMRHRDDELLTKAVKGGIRRMIGQKGAWAWTRKSPEYNITYLIAATYAVHAFAAFEPEKPRGGRVW